MKGSAMGGKGPQKGGKKVTTGRVNINEAQGPKHIHSPWLPSFKKAARPSLLFVNYTEGAFTRRVQPNTLSNLSTSSCHKRKW